MILTVILADTLVNQTAIIYENEWKPYTRRTVQIKLTPEQLDKLTLRHVGRSNGVECHEEILMSWLEGEALKEVRETK